MESDNLAGDSSGRVESMETITGSLHPQADYARVVEVAHNLIQEYGLHRHPEEMVDLLPLLSYFDLRIMDLPPETYGFTLDLQSSIVIALSDRLTERQTRFVAAHELGHVALWHPSQMQQCVKGKWLFNKLEKEATALAAYLLLPPGTVRNGLLDEASHSLVEKIAAWYKVPSELVLVRRALYAATGF